MPFIETVKQYPSATGKAGGPLPHLKVTNHSAEWVTIERHAFFLDFPNYSILLGRIVARVTEFIKIPAPFRTDSLLPVV